MTRARFDPAKSDLIREAMRLLRSIPSARRSEQSRINGRLGGPHTKPAKQRAKKKLD